MPLITPRFKILFWLFLFQCFAVNVCAVELFHPAQIRLLDSPFKHAQDLDLAYISELNADRLLAPYLREAGLEPKNEPYGNWESSGLDGHIGGHYLSALSLAYAATGEQRFLDKINYFVGQLQRVQKANGNGYIGGVPGSKKFWQEIAAGKIDANLFGINNRWVPWYNLHKIYAGLLDAYTLTGNQTARKLLIGLGEWTLDLTRNLSDSQIQKMLYAEHGGMNEVLADIYKITGDKKYLTLAQRFSEQRILDPLLTHKDALTGLHANTQIPKVVGYAKVGELADKKDWLDAAQFFWQEVVNERTISIGGNSVREHFHDKNNFEEMFEAVQGPETCNTYNMLKLSALLYQNSGEPQYVDYYERALYNHILSSQHPQTGGLVYFTSVRPQHYRTYSQVDKAMWCCVGSGIENHLKYGHFVYAHEGDQLFVNLFIPSTLDWQQKGVVLSQTNKIPDEESTTIKIKKGAAFTLNIRLPSWLAKAPNVSLNGKKIKYKKSDSYLSITRDWQNGDELKITLPMKTRTEAMPDGSPYFSMLHGPVVLSAPVNPFPEEKLEIFADGSRMGHVASGNVCSVYEAPFIVSDTLDILDRLERIPGDKLRFKLNKVANTDSGAMELLPFFRVHDTRYMIYWQLLNKKEFAALEQRKKAEEKAKIALAKRTVDWVIAGEQQPEVEHQLQSSKSETGVHMGRHWRHAFDWFSYQLSNPAKQARTLRITVSKEDSGRHYQVLLNNKLIETVHTKKFDEAGFYDLEFALPEEVAQAEKIEFKLQALPGSMAGGVYEVRLLKD